MPLPIRHHDIRELREGVYAMPFDSTYKFYIIDESSHA